MYIDNVCYNCNNTCIQIQYVYMYMYIYIVHNDILQEYNITCIYIYMCTCMYMYIYVNKKLSFYRGYAYSRASFKGRG